MIKNLLRVLISGLMLTTQLFLASKTAAENQKEAGYIRARADMVENQLIARGIKDKRVLRAMRKVERHKFLPPQLRVLAYTDRPLPIGCGQTISQPYIVALMTQLLELDGHEKILEIGTGSGYQAAILAEICSHVYTIEILESLTSDARDLLKELGYTNISVKCGDGFLGWEEYAPYDAIIVTCAPTEVPQPLLEQLKEGAKLVIPVGEYYQELKLIEKIDGQIRIKNVIPVRFVPMLRR